MLYFATLETGVLGGLYVLHGELQIPALLEQLGLIVGALSKVVGGYEVIRAFRRGGNGVAAPGKCAIK